MRRAAVLAALLAGCLTGPVDPAHDGLVSIILVNRGPPAFVVLVDVDGERPFSDRLLENETRQVTLPVRIDGCGDWLLKAGYNGTEPDIPVLTIAPCDGDRTPALAEFSPPAWWYERERRG